MTLHAHERIPFPEARLVLAILTIAISTAAGGSLQAAVLYVDGNCPLDGNGTTQSCASSAGGTGAMNSLVTGLTRVSSPGDVLRVRGVHAPHNGEAGAFDGRYAADRFRIIDKHGTATSPITIESFGYSGPGTGEAVYIEGTKRPTGDWQQCTDCSTGTCAGVPGVCSEVWFATDSVQTLVIGAQKADGTPTYRVSSIGDLTNNHAGYAGTSPEIDSYSPQNGGPILVRWGTGANAPYGASNPKPYIFNNMNGVGFDLITSSFITIRGFVIRCHRYAGVAIISPSSNIVVTDNRILYNMDTTSKGSDYGIVSYSANDVVISNNEIGFTGSEGIHTEGACLDYPSCTGSVPTRLTIRDNWIHDQGNIAVLGPAVSGTPNGMNLGEHGGSNGPGDYTGSLVAGNLIANQKAAVASGGSTGRSIIVENNSNNWVIRDNVFFSPAAECIILGGSGTSASNNQIFNNLFINCGFLNGGDASGIYVYSAPSSSCGSASGCAANNNKVYNNTFVNNRGGAINATCQGSCTGNEFRNNILYDSGSKTVMRWPASGKFQGNIVYSTTPNTVLAFNGANWTCGALLPTADVDRDGTPNDGVRCVDPLFVSLAGNDLHLKATSTAIDLGIATGLPSGKTASIANSVAGAHGLPSYADNVPMSGVAWDAGATEFDATGGSVTASLTLSDPSPTKAGSVTITLVTSVPVVNLPGPLVFRESDSTTDSIVLTGARPGTVFTGTLLVDDTVVDGAGSFSLPVNSLVDAAGNAGNRIVSGATTVIDKTPPVAPQNVQISN